MLLGSEVPEVPGWQASNTYVGSCCSGLPWRRREKEREHLRLIPAVSGRWCRTAELQNFDRLDRKCRSVFPAHGPHSGRIQGCFRFILTIICFISGLSHTVTDSRQITASVTFSTSARVRLTSISSSDVEHKGPCGRLPAFLFLELCGRVHSAPPFPEAPPCRTAGGSSLHPALELEGQSNQNLQDAETWAVATTIISYRRWSWSTG